MNQRLQQAFSSLARPEDIERFTHIDDLTRSFLEIAAQTLKAHVEESAAKYIDLAEELMTIGSLLPLPIGHATAKFFANVDAAMPTSYLATQMRTTEAHASDGKPSINGLWFPIDHASGQQIAASFRRLGNPRLQVARVIDLSGIAIPDLPGFHLLAYSYGDWFDIFGAGLTSDFMLNRDAKHRDHIRNLVRARLYPNPLSRAEIDVIARGNRGAARTRDWIDRSKLWSMGDLPVAVGAWAEHVRALAERILAHDERRPRQIRAARALIVALFAGEALADDLVGKDFATLTESAPDRREHLIATLFNTAQKPKADATITEIVTRFAAAGLKIFSIGSHGWDVCAGIRPER